MKKKLSIIEFEEYQTKTSSSCFVYDTVNQKHDIHNTIRMRAYFDNIKVLKNPNMVCLTGNNGKNQIIFERIKYVYIEESVLGTVLSFVSGDTLNNKHDKTYVVVAQ